MVEVLQTFNHEYLKYGYYAVAFGFFFMLLVITQYLGPIFKNIDKLKSEAALITDKTAKMKESTDKINHTLKESLPLFTKSLFVITLLKVIFKEYRKDKNASLPKVAVKHVTKPKNMAKLKSII